MEQRTIAIHTPLQNSVGARTQYCNQPHHDCIPLSFFLFSFFFSTRVSTARLKKLNWLGVAKPHKQRQTGWACLHEAELDET